MGVRARVYRRHFYVGWCVGLAFAAATSIAGLRDMPHRLATDDLLIVKFRNWSVGRSECRHDYRGKSRFQPNALQILLPTGSGLARQRAYHRVLATLGAPNIATGSLRQQGRQWEARSDTAALASGMCQRQESL